MTYESSVKALPWELAVCPKDGTSEFIWVTVALAGRDDSCMKWAKAKGAGQWWSHEWRAGNRGGREKIKYFKTCY